jgi:hypothetical protein
VLKRLAVVIPEVEEALEKNNWLATERLVVEAFVKKVEDP